MAVWRFFSVELAHKVFPVSGKTFKELKAENLFKFATGRVTHFVTYRLTASDAFAAYNRGRPNPGMDDEEVTSIVEEVVDKEELVQLVKYEGFTRLGASPLFLAWGVHAEDSLVRETFAERGGHLKLVYTF